MATTPNVAIRPQTARRATAVLTAATTVYSGNNTTVGAIKLCDVGTNNLSWLVRLSTAPRSVANAYNLMLFWSPDLGNTMNYVTKFSIPAVTAVPAAETDCGLSEQNFRILAPANTSVNTSSFYVAMDIAVANGVVVSAEIEDA